MGNIALSEKEKRREEKVFLENRGRDTTFIGDAQNSVDKQLSEDAPWKRSRAWKPLHWATTTPNSLKVSS